MTDQPQAESTHQRRITRWWVVLTLAVVVALASSLVTASITRSTLPDHAGPEAGFARDMQIHHAQAVEMSMLVRDRTDDPALRTVAYDIALTQQQQQGQLFGWLVVWKLPQARSGAAMAWMNGNQAMSGSHTGAHGPELMPGMATREQIEALRAASGKPAEVLFLQLMIAHHRGGIEMANAVLTRTDNDIVLQFAQSVRTAQTTEIDQMQTMLEERGAARV